MKLFLYSGGTREENHKLNLELKEILPATSRITYIPSASDEERKHFKEFSEWFSYYGYKKFYYFELEEGFGKSKALEALKSRAIYLSGGNTYNFLYWILKRKFDRELKMFVKNGGLLIGESAGSMIMTNNIDLTGLFDSGSENECKVNPSKTLKLMNFELFPHYKSRVEFKKKGLKRIDEILLKTSKKRNWPIVALREGEGVIVADDGIEFVGKPTVFVGGGKFSLY